MALGLFDVIWWPFATLLAGATFLLAILILIFWILMIIDCAKRKFKNDIEKIIWIIIIVLASWLGALIYLIVIKLYNSKGIIKK